jgi:hypothetical protein
MKKIITLLFCIVSISTRGAGINGTYLFEDFEYMQIENDSFRIISYEGFNGDSIVAQGSIKKTRESNFIELTSKPFGNVYDNIKIEECYDSSLVDSVKIKFVFPYNGDHKILLFPALFCTYSDSIMISNRQYKLKVFPWFNIVNCDSPIDIEGTTLGRIHFIYRQDYEVKNENTNVVIIYIPNLTNSYFNRYVILNEFAKVDSRKLLWRGRVYKKVSDKLITPEVPSPIVDYEDINLIGVDPADEYLKKK